MSSREADLEIDTEQYFRHLSFEKTKTRFFHHATKRTMDILLASMGLIMALPIFLIISILIKIDDPKGSIFFKQTRLGRYGRSFQMYKFRSMVTNADQMLGDILHLNEVEGPMFKIKSDPRITRIGRFIRKTSLDEFPQFINVLKGEMSIVGPRPPLPWEVEEYTYYERQRLQVVPGCTGLWQVTGRNKVSFKEMVELDLYYIQKRSIWLDIKLIFKTISVIIHSKDAY